MEALTAIPGSVTDMIAMESQGKCHWLVFDQAKMRLAYNGFIQIPKIKWPTNLEGFGLMKVGDKFLAAWGHRGKSKYPGKLFWGWLVFNSRTVEAVDSIEISVEWPTEHVRHIADLKINEFGDCWIVATSDPGDDGPFSSALYHIGRFQIEDNQINFYQILSRKPAFKFETHKVEGFDFIDNGIITATDDENFGGSIKTVILSKDYINEAIQNFILTTFYPLAVHKHGNGPVEPTVNWTGQPLKRIIFVFTITME